MKKLLIAFGILFALLLAAAVAIPYFFKDEIVAQIKASANENLNAKLDFADVDVSLFRHFPKLTVGLKGLDITGIGPFEGTRLMHCENMDVAVNLWSAIFGNELTVSGLHLNRPAFHVFVLKDGTANYRISKAPEASSSSGNMKLENYTITDGSLTYDDRALGTFVEVTELNHTGKGDFAGDISDLTFKTDAGKFSLNYGGVQYLTNAHAVWNATVNSDLANRKFILTDNLLKVNDLQVNLEGWTSLPNEDDVLMDLKWSTPQNTFKSLLSIVPGAYTQDFGSVAANGTVQFDGMVKGKFNAGSARSPKIYPAFVLNFKVGNADFKYPALPLGVSGIHVDASIKSPGADLNGMTVDIPKFALRIGSNPLEGYFHLKNPVKDPAVDTKILGTLNLGELTKAFPMAGVQELSGIFKSDVLLKASQSQLDLKLYDQVTVAGSLNVSNLTYRSTTQPPVKINSMAMTFSPQFVDVQQFDARLGRSDLRATGRVDNLLAYFSPEKTMTGTLDLHSILFDANEWMTPAPTAEEAAAGPGKVPVDRTKPKSEKAFDRWDFTLGADFKKLKYSTHELTDVSGHGHFTPNKMDVSDFALKIGESDLSGSGQILNAWKFMFDNETVAGTIKLTSKFFDTRPFMTKPDPKAPVQPATGVMPVPENVDMTINANMGKVLYSNMTLENLDGQIVVRDQKAQLKDCTANTLGGQIGLTGEYNTQDLAKPSFNMDMALQNFSFRDAYQNFSTVKAFGPIAQLMDGKFNTSLSLSGLLGKDMMPDMTTLSAAGFVETLNAVFNNWKPAEAIGDKLNIAALKKFELKNTKNWFEIKGGNVTVKPFDVKLGDVAVKIGGSTGISREMNFQFLTRTPRKLLEKNAVGAAASSGLNWVSGEASKLGLNIKQGDFVNVRFDMTGTMFSPKIAIKLLGSDGESTMQEQASEAVKQSFEKAKDSISKVAQREVNKVKDKAAAEAQRIQDSLARLANQQIESAKNKAAEAAKQEAGKVLGKEVGDKVGDKAGEVLGDKGKKTVEESKKKLDEWNPFKKKKN